MMMMMHKAKYVTICLSVLFSASRTTFLMFIGTNDSELKNVAGLAQRFVGPNDSELKNVAGVVRRGSLKLVYATICLSVLFSASRTTLLMFIGTNDSELKNVAGLVRRGSLALTTAS